jgi:hypothetical protein
MDCRRVRPRKKYRVGWSERDATSPTGWAYYPNVCTTCWGERDRMLRAERERKWAARQGRTRRRRIEGVVT